MHSLQAAKQASIQANQQFLAARAQGGEWRKPISQQSPPPKLLERVALHRALLALRTQRRLQQRIVTARKSAIYAAKKAAWATQEAKLGWKGQAALVKARGLVHSAAAQITKAEEEMTHRALLVNQAGVAVKKAHQQYISDTQVFKSARKLLEDSSDAVVAATPEWQAKALAATQHQAYYKAAQAVANLEEARARMDAAKATLRRANQHAARMRRDESSALHRLIGELELLMKHGMEKMDGLEALPGRLRAKLEGSLAETIHRGIDRLKRV